MKDDLSDYALQVEAIDTDRLLTSWRWLYPRSASLLAKNVFGELFLLDHGGSVFWLNVTEGTLQEASPSLARFLELIHSEDYREKWLAATDARNAIANGLKPNLLQCVGFKIPLVFAQSATAPNNAYIADIYDYVGGLGDLHQQMAQYPDGARVKLVVK